MPVHFLGWLSQWPPACGRCGRLSPLHFLFLCLHCLCYSSVIHFDTFSYFNYFMGNISSPRLEFLNLCQQQYYVHSRHSVLNEGLPQMTLSSLNTWDLGWDSRVHVKLWFSCGVIEKSAVIRHRVTPLFSFLHVAFHCNWVIHIYVYHTFVTSGF